MATLAGLIDRARLEIGDLGRPFQSQVIGDAAATLITIPHKPVEATGLTVTLTNANGSLFLTSPIDYVLDDRNGTLTLTNPVPVGTTMTVTGTKYRYFTTGDWTSFVNTAFLQHNHGIPGGLARLDPVEDYLVVLLALCEAIYALMNDSAFDIDIATPEGVSIPRHQRFDQLMQMLMARQDQYNRLSSALNVGLGRIEMFDLRRVSRSTNRLVPLYISQELEDTSFPVRAFPRIDRKGAPVAADGLPDVDLTIIQGEAYTTNVVLNRDVTGAEVRATLRRYPNSAAYKYFHVNVTDLLTGKFDITMTPQETLNIGGGPYFWDVRLLRNGAFESIVEGKVSVEERPRS